jgi:hypothetical protein
LIGIDGAIAVAVVSFAVQVKLPLFTKVIEWLDVVPAALIKRCLKVQNYITFEQALQYEAASSDELKPFDRRVVKGRVTEYKSTSSRSVAEMTTIGGTRSRNESKLLQPRNSGKATDKQKEDDFEPLILDETIKDEN